VGGSFYVNSPVMGNWETYTVSEVVSYIDSNYHTISEAGARGICGFSMGGFASINLAFRHPDVYSAVYAMSPGLLAPGKIKDAFETWEGDQIFLEAYSMAFAYKDQAPYIEIPSGDGSEADQILMERWESGFGNLQEKLDDYLALGVPLKSIGFCYGENDGYQWIPEGTCYLAGLLDKKGISYDIYSFQGGHILPPDFVKDQLFPFFQTLFLMSKIRKKIIQRSYNQYCFQTVNKAAPRIKSWCYCICKNYDTIMADKKIKRCINYTDKAKSKKCGHLMIVSTVGFMFGTCDGSKYGY